MRLVSSMGVVAGPRSGGTSLLTPILDSVAANTQVATSGLNYARVQPAISGWGGAWLYDDGYRNSKRYFEVLVTQKPEAIFAIGFADVDVYGSAVAGEYHDSPIRTGYRFICGGSGSGLSTGYYIDGTGTSDSAYAFATGDVIGVAVDYSTGKVWFRKNGTWIAGDPVAGTGQTFTLPDNRFDPYISTYGIGPATWLATVHITASSFSASPPTGFIPLAQAIEPANDPYWANVPFLLNTTGADNSTTFTDASTYGHSITALANAKIVSNRAVFDTVSVLRVPRHTSHHFGSRDFTAEVRGAMTNLNATGEVALMSVWKSGGISWFFGINNTKNLVFYYSVDGSSGIFSIVTTDTVPLPPTDCHLAASRVSGILRLFINGVKKYEASHPSSFHSPASTPFCVGGVDYSAQQLSGNVIHRTCRITNGVGRYINNFTPPTGPFMAA